MTGTENQPTDLPEKREKKSLVHITDQLHDNYITTKNMMVR